MKKYEHAEPARSVKGSLQSPPIPKVKKPVAPAADHGPAGKSPIQVKGFGKARMR